MTKMHNPPHPGEILREYLGDITVTRAARDLGVSRVTLSGIVTREAGYRLASALGTSPEMRGRACRCSTTCIKPAS